MEGFILGSIDLHGIAIDEEVLCTYPRPQAARETHAFQQGYDVYKESCVRYQNRSGCITEQVMPRVREHLRQLSVE